MTLSLQEQLAATKKNHILHAAVTVFAQKGYHAATIRDVSRQAGVSDGTIYNYFENKGALLLGIFQAMSSAAQQAINPQSLQNLDLRGFLRLFVAQPLQALRGEHFELLRVVISEVMVNPELAAQFRAGVLEPMTKQAGVFAQEWAAQDWAARSGQPLPFTALAALDTRLLSSLILGVLVQTALGDETLERHWDELPDKLVELLLGGLFPGGVGA